MVSQSQNLPDPAPMSPDEQRSSEANLAFFMHDRFAPVINRVDSKTMSAQQSFVQAELLESFLWLHHGVGIGYFPAPLSRRVTYEYFPTFLKAYESVRFESYFETWFTPPLRAIFEIEFTGNQELFSSGRIWKNRPAGSDALFQPYLILANDLVQNAKARLVMQAIALHGDSKWYTDLQNSFDTVELDEEDSLDEKGQHWMYPGFFSLLEYMRAFRVIKLDLAERFNDSDSQYFLRLLKETQQWRLNFGYAKNRERFMEVARWAAETYIKRIAVDQPNASWAVDDFLQSFYELITDWGAPLVKGAGA